jgi:methionine synthase I (cobalamin-dependent)
VDCWITDRPDEIARVHRAFAAAGAEIALAGTFRLLPGLHPDWHPLAVAAVALARDAGVATWASLGPGPGPSGWAEVGQALAPLVDGFYLETFLDPRALDAAVRALLPHGRPVVASLVPGIPGTSLPPAEMAPWFARWRALGATPGLNCAPPEDIAACQAALGDTGLWLKPSGRMAPLVGAALGGCCGVDPPALAAFHARAG